MLSRDLCSKIVSGEVRLDLIIFSLSLIPNVPIDATGILLSFSI